MIQSIAQFNNNYKMVYFKIKKAFHQLNFFTFNNKINKFLCINLNRQ